jgi:hypothetical protein
MSVGECGDSFRKGGTMKMSNLVFCVQKDVEDKKQ